MILRSSGVLLPISSLPGPYGIGLFGEEAVTFAKRIRQAGFTYWQVLPFSEPGDGDSPYQSISAYAGNSLFIDPRQLRAEGLLTDSELEDAVYPGPDYATDYSYAAANSNRFLRLAFSRRTPELIKEIRAFTDRTDWLMDVALFLAVRERYANTPWWEWPDEKLRLHEEDAVKSAREELEDEVLFFCYVQFEFSRQWFRLKSRINQLGIRIIGDLPIYVSADSADVWANSRLFQMKEDRTFARVAGVPPDYFCEDGQLWGNPLYDWSTHAKEGYTWWLQRLAVNFSLFDIVRIDHFRGFSSYWSVDSAETTARKGFWAEGPGMDLFRKVAEFYPDAPIIAEDLGDIDDGVRTFLSASGFPGMRVLQFAFDPVSDSTHLPHNYERNTVAYSGTHDNNTLLGWLWDASESEREFALSYCGIPDVDWGVGGVTSPGCRGILRTLFGSHASLVVTPIQDLLGYGKDTRMNIPGKPSGNWTFRVTREGLNALDLPWLLSLNRLYRRENSEGDGEL